MADLNELRNVIAAAFGGDVFAHQSTIGTGFWLPTGREVGMRVEFDLAGHVILTDGGDTWGELMNEGIVEREPTTAEKDRLTEAIAPFAVSLQRDMTLSVRCAPAAVADAVKRLLLASTSALAVVRVLASERVERDYARRRELVQSVADLATKSGWKADRRGRVRGRSGHEWPCSVLLDRSSDGRASGVLITHEQPSRIIERAFGWRADTNNALVIVSNKARAHKINETHISGVVAIADDGGLVGENVLHAAEALIAA